MSGSITVARDRDSDGFRLAFIKGKDVQFCRVNAGDWAVLWTGSDYRWDVNLESNEIVCEVHARESGKTCFTRRLPLRAGVIILSDLTEFNESNPCAKATFRSPELQAFLDKYGICAICRRTLKKGYLYGVDSEQDGIRVCTTNVYADSKVIVDTEDGFYYLNGASWALERRVSFSSMGEVLDATYLLHTNIRDLKRLEESFAKKGILPR